MGPIHSIADVIDMVRRRASIMMYVICFGCVMSLWVALKQTHVYSSAEVIQIARPKIADEMVPSTVVGSSARRLQLIEQQLMARGYLLVAIDELGLFADNPGLRPSEKVNLLREAIHIRGVAAAREGFSDDGTISVLTISAHMETPELAQLVAHEFAQRTIELSVNSRIAQAQETLDFFVLQEEKLEARVAALQKRIAAFRNDNDVAVEGNVEFRRSEMAAINAAILDIDRQRITLEREADQVDSSVRPATASRLLSSLQSKMEGLDAQKTVLTGRLQELAAAIETNPAVQHELATFERQLENLQNQLGEASLRRTEADVGFRIESQRQSERLTVLEPAPLPDFPVTSSRKQIALLGGMFSILAALVLALVLEILNPVIRSAGQMKRELGIVPVVTIPFLDDMSAKKPGLFRRLLNKFGSAKPKRRQGFDSPM